MITFDCKTFRELSLDELYAMMVLRQEIFVVEQDAPYLDADRKDQDSWHLMGKDKDGNLLAYLRILPKGTSYKNYPAIGRVAISEKMRKKGMGRILMQKGLVESERLFPGQGIKISAQVYLLKFYQSLGFQVLGEEYIEDGLPHIAMVRKEG